MRKLLNENEVKRSYQELFELFLIFCVFAGSKSTQSFKSGDAKQQIRSRPKQRSTVILRLQQFFLGVTKGATRSGWFALKYLITKCFVFIHGFDNITFSYSLLKEILGKGFECCRLFTEL